MGSCPCQVVVFFQRNNKSVVLGFCPQKSNSKIHKTLSTNVTKIKINNLQVEAFNYIELFKKKKNVCAINVQQIVYCQLQQSCTLKIHLHFLTNDKEILLTSMNRPNSSLSQNHNIGFLWPVTSCLCLACSFRQCTLPCPFKSVFSFHAAVRQVNTANTFPFGCYKAFHSIIRKCSGNIN